MLQWPKEGEDGGGEVAGDAGGSAGDLPAVLRMYSRKYYRSVRSVIPLHIPRPPLQQDLARPWIPTLAMFPLHANV